MTKIRRLAGAGVLTLTIALVAVACSSNSSTSGASGGGFDGAALTGAGATFPDPIYEQWFKDFQQVESGAKINYQAIGSGGGVISPSGTGFTPSPCTGTTTKLCCLFAFSGTGRQKI